MEKKILEFQEVSDKKVWNIRDKGKKILKFQPKKFFWGTLLGGKAGIPGG